MSTSDFADAVIAHVPAARSLVEENWDDEDDELLLHPFMYDLFVLAKSAYAAGDQATATWILRIVDDGLVLGDGHVQNAVALSFVEHYGAGPDETKAFLSTWPRGLRDELAEQRSLAIGRWWNKIRSGRQNRG
ncbi:DUF7674 family protein [Curtobacterium sp. 24E2]|nr:hypothetical protein JN350_09210 [Curtobacterium sp. 24E2]